jgi:hypothetical protein
MNRRRSYRRSVRHSLDRRLRHSPLRLFHSRLYDRRLRRFPMRLRQRTARTVVVDATAGTTYARASPAAERNGRCERKPPLAKVIDRDHESAHPIGIATHGASRRVDPRMVLQAFAHPRRIYERLSAILSRTRLYSSLGH